MVILSRVTARGAALKRAASMPLGRSVTSARPLSLRSCSTASPPTADSRVGHAAHSGTSARKSSDEAASTREWLVNSDGTPMSCAT